MVERDGKLGSRSTVHLTPLRRRLIEPGIGLRTQEGPAAKSLEQKLEASRGVNEQRQCSVVQHVLSLLLMMLCFGGARLVEFTGVRLKAKLEKV